MFRLCSRPPLWVLLCCGWLCSCLHGLQAQECDATFSHDLIVDGYIDPGSGPTDSPVYEEESIKLQFDTYTDSNGSDLYGSAFSASAISDFGNGQFLALEGISAVYTFDAALPLACPPVKWWSRSKT